MEVLNPRCGWGCAQKLVVVCAKVNGKKEPQTFNTCGGTLRQMGKWLVEKQIWNLLASMCCWPMPNMESKSLEENRLADLHRCGRIRGSRVPNRENRELQELVRARRKLIGPA